MTVKELRAILADAPDDALVVMASDAEGNEYSPLHCADLCVMVGENRNIEIYDPEFEEHVDVDTEPCVALWRV